MNETTQPFVSIVIPCRNEERFIRQALNSIIANDYPKVRLEVLVVDGMSKDSSRAIIVKYSQQYQFIKLLENSAKITPVAFNVGVNNARGDIIVIVGAHATYSSNYISTIVKYIANGQADCVGSVIKTLPAKGTLLGKVICMAISSPFGAGNSVMRTGTKNACYVDTASCSGYKREVFEKIGLFNENLIHTQDMEFNWRLKRAGGRILLVPDITSYYYARSDFFSFCKHNFRNGAWVIYPMKFVAHLPVAWRHLVPIAFVLSLIFLSILSSFLSVGWYLFLLLIGLYSMLSVYFSSRIMLQEKDIRYLFIMPPIFFLLHLVYGLGSIWGFANVAGSKQFWRNLKSYLVSWKVAL